MDWYKGLHSSKSLIKKILKIFFSPATGSYGLTIAILFLPFNTPLTSFN